MAQINPTVGDFPTNVALVLDAARQAAAAGASLVVCSELCLTGYPPRDLLERPGFMAQAAAALDDLAAKLDAEGLPAVLVGHPLPAADPGVSVQTPNSDAEEPGALSPCADPQDHPDRGPKLTNAAVLLDPTGTAPGASPDGQHANPRVRFVQTKCLLPNYDIFDEQRYFRPGASRRF